MQYQGAADDAWELYEVGCADVDASFGAHLSTVEEQAEYRRQVQKMLKDLWDLHWAYEAALFDRLKKETCYCGQDHE